MLFSLLNLPYWILLGVGVGLFLLVILAGGGDEDLEVEAELDSELEADGGSLWSWLGVGEAPLILLLALDFSLWGLLGWLVQVTLLGWLGSLGNRGQFLVLMGSLVVAIGLGRWIARPIGLAFAGFGEDASEERLIGRVGTVSSQEIPLGGRIGQVDVLDTHRNRVTVSARLPEWATAAPKRGQEVILIERGSQGYVVILKDSPDEAHWLRPGSSPTLPE
ncbi:YqiJ family protein [Synechococcus sp. Nb3U1]|uniref:OB-fold-containig protein n=1 Tax=Synechococcus sp. Nb3U1 TaxID=1914529 RepID=UPI001F204E64|nr:OB-fold-containig protein [Synechococcus sp. Nb3U1]MCF2969628.1 YqiJ family protein [Synechococcus sp. Nb3U1]